MSIFDDIRKDREAGTPGPWGLSEAVHVWVMAGNLHVATIPRATDGDWSPANARRIARVPRLERIALAAEELAEAADWFRASTDAYMKNGGADNAERSILAESAFVKSFAAFRAACGEGE